MIERRDVRSTTAKCTACRVALTRGEDAVFIAAYKKDTILCLSCAEIVGDLAITITGKLTDENFTPRY